MLLLRCSSHLSLLTYKLFKVQLSSWIMLVPGANGPPYHYVIWWRIISPPSGRPEPQSALPSKRAGDAAVSFSARKKCMWDELFGRRWGGQMGVVLNTKKRLKLNLPQIIWKSCFTSNSTSTYLSNQSHILVLNNWGVNVTKHIAGLYSKYQRREYSTWKLQCAKAVQINILHMTMHVITNHCVT